MRHTVETMMVSRFAERAGVTTDTVRYYERIGLLPAAARDTNGYRRYRIEDVERLRFIRQAQQFGLSLDDIRQLLAVRDDGLCPCGHATDLLAERLRELDEQISSLQDLRGDIASLLEGDVSAGLACRSSILTLSTETP